MATSPTTPQHPFLPYDTPPQPGRPPSAPFPYVADPRTMRQRELSTIHIMRLTGSGMLALGILALAVSYGLMCYLTRGVYNPLDVFALIAMGATLMAGMPLTLAGIVVHIIAAFNARQTERRYPSPAAPPRSATPDAGRSDDGRPDGHMDDRPETRPGKPAFSGPSDDAPA